MVVRSQPTSSLLHHVELAVGFPGLWQILWDFLDLQGSGAPAAPPDLATPDLTIPTEPARDFLDFGRFYGFSETSADFEGISTIYKVLGLQAPPDLTIPASQGHFLFFF